MRHLKMPLQIASRQNSEALTLPTGNDGASVTHTATRRGGPSSDEANNRFWFGAAEVVPLEVLGSFLFHATTNLANDNDT